MKKLIAIALCALTLTACAARPDAKVEVHEVKVAVPVPCPVKLGDRPELRSKEQIASDLAAAPTFDDRIKILSEQLLLYIGWVPKVEGALAGCVAVPKPAAP